MVQLTTEQIQTPHRVYEREQAVNLMRFEVVSPRITLRSIR